MRLREVRCAQEMGRSEIAVLVFTPRRGGNAR
jgi:hypothetical protein